MYSIIFSHMKNLTSRLFDVMPTSSPDYTQLSNDAVPS